MNNIKDTEVTDLKNRFPDLTTFEALSLLLIAAQNNILRQGFDVHQDAPPTKADIKKRFDKRVEVYKEMMR